MYCDGLSCTARDGAKTAREAHYDSTVQAQLGTAAQTGLARVQAKQSTWTRADLMKHIGLALPSQSRDLDPAEAVAQAQELTDRAIAGEFQAIAELTAPEFPATPEYLRRDLEGRSVYTRPGSQRYATNVQLSLEEQLLQSAQRAGAPRLEREQAAQLLGAGLAAIDAQFHERAATARESGEKTPSGLRLDQATALHYALTSAAWQARRRISAKDQNAAGPAGGMDRAVATEFDGTLSLSMLMTSASVALNSPIAAGSRSWPGGASFHVLTGSTASSEPRANGAVAVSCSGIPAVADRTAASTQEEATTRATDANEASAHSGRFDRQRAGSGRPAAKKPAPQLSAFMRLCACGRGAYDCTISPCPGSSKSSLSRRGGPSQAM